MFRIRQLFETEIHCRGVIGNVRDTVVPVITDLNKTVAVTKPDPVLPRAPNARLAEAQKALARARKVGIPLGLNLQGRQFASLVRSLARASASKP